MNKPAETPARAARGSDLSYTIIDADAHMSEPADLWTSRIDRKFADQAPRVVDSYKGKQGMHWIFEDIVQRFSHASQGGHSTMLRPGGWDPAERLKDMEIDGVAAAVLYSTLAFNLFGTRNQALQEACFRVYNDWLAEFCAYAPDRLVGLALISLYDVESGVRELERCRKAGLKGAMIWAQPPEDLPSYASNHYDAFWAAAQSLGVPVSLHTNTSGVKHKAYSVESEGQWGMQYTYMVMQQVPLQESILRLTFSGALERFPGLKLICAEGDISWMPPLMQRADKYYASSTRRGHALKLEMTPSEYLRRQVWISFIKDPLGLKTYQNGNLADRIMWSTDYPHAACFFPNSRQVFEEDFAGVPEADKRKFVHDNAAELFGFPV